MGELIEEAMQTGLIPTYTGEGELRRRLTPEEQRQGVGYAQKYADPFPVMRQYTGVAEIEAQRRMARALLTGPGGGPATYPYQGAYEAEFQGPEGRANWKARQARIAANFPDLVPPAAAKPVAYPGTRAPIELPQAEKPPPKKRQRVNLAGETVYY